MVNEFYAKIHESEKGSVLAVCDEDLLGKTISEEGRDFEISEKFYGGELIGEEELKELLLNSDTINLIGNGCVEVAEEIGIIENKIMIDGIAHAQIYEVE